MASFLAGCGDDNDVAAPPPPPVTTGIVKVTVKSGVDSSLVENSNVVLYRAENNEAVLRDLTTENGIVYFNVEPGDYYLNISAQGFDPLPLENIIPIPFFVSLADTMNYLRTYCIFQKAV